jgi:CheY-like chemotaxis protein
LIALTAWSQPADRQRTAAAGFDQHLTKPVDPDHLGVELRALIAAVPDRQ